MTRHFRPLFICTVILASVTTAKAQTSDLSQVFPKSTWGIIAAVIVTAVLAPIIVNYVSERIKPRVTKQLAWDLIVSQVLSDVDPTVRDNVAVSYKGQSVQHLYSMNCVIENTGNRAVKNEIIRFPFDDKTTVLEPPNLHDAVPELEVHEVAALAELGHQPRFSIGQLETSQQVSLRFILDSPAPPDFKPVGHNAEGDVEFVQRNVTRVRQDREIVRHFIRLFLLYYFAPVLANIIPIEYAAQWTAGLIEFGIILAMVPYLSSIPRICAELLYDARSSVRGSVSVNTGGALEKGSTLIVSTGPGGINVVRENGHQ